MQAAQRGGIAQLVEHLLCKQGVAGSSPTTSTNLIEWLEIRYKPFLRKGLYLISREIRAGTLKTEQWKTFQKKASKQQEIASCGNFKERQRSM